MIVGFNHNVNYRGVGFHVQTEDSGPKNPQLVTLLYHSGTIICSQKTVYADILKVDNLDQVIEDLAKEQHKGMLRRLTKGEFDQRIIEFGIPITSATGGKPQTPAPISDSSKESAAAPAVKQDSTQDAAKVANPGKPIATKPDPATVPRKIVEEPMVDKFRKPQPAEERNLDELIFAYLTATDQIGRAHV